MIEPHNYRPPRRFLIIAFLLSVTLGILYLRSIREVPQYRIPVLDEWSYDSKAMGLLDGTWPDRKVYYQDPLYPYFLAFIYKIIGHRIGAVKYLQVFLGGLHVLLIFGITRRIFGKGAGMAAALIAALYKPLFFFEGILTKEILSLVLMDASLLTLLWAREKGGHVLVTCPPPDPRVADRGHVTSTCPLTWAVSGLLLGLTCLTRANAVLLVPVWAMWCLLSVRREAGIKTGLKMAAALLAGCLVAIAPATIHNLRSGDCVLLTSQGGQNFYIGNHPDNQSGTYISPPFLRAHPMFEEDDFRSETKRLVKEELKPSETSRFWYDRSIEYARSEPKAFWRNMWLKTALFFNNFEVSDNVNYYFYKEKFAWPLRLPLPNYGVLAMFGLFGWFLLIVRRGRGEGIASDGGWPLIFFLPIYAASTIAYYIFDRYRVPVLTVLIPLSAYGLNALWELRAPGKRRKFALALLVIIALGVGAYWPLKEPQFDGAWYQLGNGYQQLGNYPEAEKAYRKAVLLSPGVPAHRLNLGLAIDAQGRHEDAALEFQRSVGIFPEDPKLREAYANVLVVMGRTADAIVQYELAINSGGDSPRLFYNLGLAYKKMGMEKNAQLYFRYALEKDPHYQPALDELR